MKGSEAGSGTRSSDGGQFVLWQRDPLSIVNSAIAIHEVTGEPTVGSASKTNLASLEPRPQHL